MPHSDWRPSSREFLDLKFDQGNESPDIFYMRLKAAFSENLLAKDGKFHGQAQATSEVFSPMAESMIVIKWLEAINPALPRHIQDTRATLFTSEKPNFADIQQDLCEIMDTLLQEIEQVDSVSALSVHDDYDLTVEAIESPFKGEEEEGEEASQTATELLPDLGASILLPARSDKHLRLTSCADTARRSARTPASTQAMMWTCALTCTLRRGEVLV